MVQVASSPAYLSVKDIPQNVVDSEKAIFEQQTILENEALPIEKKKKSEQLDKMISGRVQKRLNEICLLTQLHLVEEGQPLISKHLTSMSQSLKNELSISKMIHWTVGKK